MGSNQKRGGTGGAIPADIHPSRHILAEAAHRPRLARVPQRATFSVVSADQLMCAGIRLPVLSGLSSSDSTVHHFRLLRCWSNLRQY